jgi:tRNA(fMet)-specific endonuclease VapC
MLLDTSFLIDLLRGTNQEALHKAQELDQKLESKGIAPITTMELWRGAMQCLNQEKEKKKVNELISSLFAYPFSENEAKKSGEIEAKLLAKGNMIDLEDIMIAGVAQVHEEPILTRNKKHFEKIENLQIETY